MLDDVMKRMRRVEGQARGIQNMLATGAECESILLQLSAMKAALSRVGLKLLGCQLSRRLSDDLKRGGTGEAAMDEAVETLMRL